MVPCIHSELTSLDQIALTIFVYDHIKDKHEFPEELEVDLLVLDKEYWR